MEIFNNLIQGALAGVIVLLLGNYFNRKNKKDNQCSIHLERMNRLETEIKLLQSQQAYYNQTINDTRALLDEMRKDIKTLLSGKIYE